MNDAAYVNPVDMGEDLPQSILEMEGDKIKKRIISVSKKTP